MFILAEVVNCLGAFFEAISYGFDVDRVVR